jgi:hypothetical protein
MTTESNLEIPALGSITPEWLNQALRNRPEFAGTQIASVEIQPLAEGVGMMSSLARVLLTYEPGPAGPSSIVAKGSASADSQNRPVAETFNLYGREVAFIRDIAPHTPARTPVCFYADINDAHESIIIMEDLPNHVTGDQTTGCTMDQAEACIKELAALHGAFWDNVDDPIFDQLPYHRSAVHGDNYPSMTATFWDPVLEMYPDLIPEELAQAKDGYIEWIFPAQDWLSASPATVVHGDFRMANILFSDASGEPPVVVVDWQGSLRCKGIQDVAYLLSQSMNVEDRRASERALVDLYSQELAKLGVDYPPEVAFEDYRRAVTYLWLYAVIIAGSLDQVNEAGAAWMRKMVERSAAAVMDLHGLELL